MSNGEREQIDGEEEKQDGDEETIYPKKKKDKNLLRQAEKQRSSCRRWAFALENTISSFTESNPFLKS